MSTTSTELFTSMHFLKEDELYKTTKPYSLRFEPPPGFPRSNISMERHENLRIEDMRAYKDDFSVDKQGFEIMHLQSSMAYESYDDETMIKEVYLKEVADALREHFNATKVHIFEHTVRKRHETFPIATGKPYKYNQPTAMAHIDTTVEWVADMVRQLNEPAEAQKLLSGRVQSINIWKPIKGPVRDWPLALCDIRSIKHDDLEPADLVYPDYVVENQQLHLRPYHKWYYIRDQQPHEAWIFRQSDSWDDDRLGVPHSAFPNPLATASDEARESIEARAIVYG